MSKINKETAIKIRAWFLLAFAILSYPIALILTISMEICLQILRAKRQKCIAGDIALVTGGGQGLGKCIAMELAKKNCHIAIADINMEEAEETVKFLIERYNIKAKAYKVDVSDYEQVAALNKNIIEDLGLATILINNAGVLTLNNFLQPHWQEVQRMINVNLTSHFWTNQIFLPNMKAKRKGHIVAISSLSGMLPLAFSSQYTSTKYAVRGMMRALRLELKANRHINGDEIYATTVSPNFLQTNAKVAAIVKKTGIDAVYPLMSGQEVAVRVVEGILRNEEEIVLPGFMSIIHRLYETLSASSQDLLLFLQAYNTVKHFGKLKD